MIIKNSDNCCLTWNAKIAHRAWQALHPLADGVLQLKYDLLIVEKRYDRGPRCHEVISTTTRYKTAA